MASGTEQLARALAAQEQPLYAVDQYGQRYLHCARCGIGFNAKTRANEALDHVNAHKREGGR